MTGRSHEWRENIQYALGGGDAIVWWQCWRCMTVAETTEARAGEDERGCQP